MAKLERAHDAQPPEPRELDVASLFGFKNLVSALLEQGANVEAVNAIGTTPLMNASREGHVDIVQMLLDHGADIDRVDPFGRSALFLALDEHKNAVVKLLINRGAKLDEIADGTTVLMEQCHSPRGRLANVELLLDGGANVNLANRAGITALMCTSFRYDHDKVAIIELLLRHGAAIDQVDREGNTALAYACKHLCLGNVRVLLEHGATVTSRCLELQQETMRDDPLVAPQIRSLLLAKQRARRHRPRASSHKI